MNPLPIDPRQKVLRHIDAIFGAGVSQALPAKDLQFEFSRKTGRIKNFSLGGKLVATLRTDGGLALTIFGAERLLLNSGSDNAINSVNSSRFRENCVEPTGEAIPFVSEGRSLFCRHVKWCGANVRVGSDVAVVDRGSGSSDKNNGGKVIAVGVALLSSRVMQLYGKGVAVRIREGIKGRTEQQGTAT